MDISFSDYALHNVQRFNVILGKNGCGKSSLLRALEANRRGRGYVRYITPERGGVLNRDGGVETNMSNQDWLYAVRNQNRFEQFRQTSASEFRRLETLVLRKIERDPKLRADPNYTFDTTLAQINTLLDNVQVVRADDGGFKVRNKGSSLDRDHGTLSSGESELVSLAIEVLAYAFATEDEKYANTENFLLFDEPDVHLHPDLQKRLMDLLVTAASGRPFRTVIATHSTAIAAALAEQADARIDLMGRGAKQLTFRPIDKAMRDVLPIFGAHPLSNVFNQKPVLLVEGEDDARIWQQATRSSGGQIQVWPCEAGDIQSLNEYEVQAQRIVLAVYDDARAFSLRDRDNDPYEIDDLLPVVRARLQCRAAENLLLADDTLTLLGTKWEQLKEGMSRWLVENGQHTHHSAMLAFQATGWDRQMADLKSIRNLILAVVGSSKPWEVVVGQAVAGLTRHAASGEHSLTSYLGPKLVDALGLRPVS